MAESFRHAFRGGTYRSIAQVLDAAHQVNGFADQTGDVVRRRCVEVRSGAGRRVLLQEIGEEAPRTGRGEVICVGGTGERGNCYELLRKRVGHSAKANGF